MPLIFPPLAGDEHLLADGYLSDPLPIGVALQEGADVILPRLKQILETAP